MNEEIKSIELVGNVGEATTEVNYKAASKKLFYKFVKRTFDILLSVFGLLFLIPIAIIVKIIYMCTGDFHSIFFTQKRIGKEGKEFSFYKFRTMVPNADKELEKLLASDPARKKEYEINKKLKDDPYEINKKLKDDPRITLAGKFLRKSSLDELPQLLNVFCVS